MWKSSSVKLELKIYRLFNPDLHDKDNDDLVLHYKKFGKNENRIYNVETALKLSPLLRYVNMDDYIESNKDIVCKSRSEYIVDYVKNRLLDNRIISKELCDFKNVKKQHIFDIVSDHRDDMNYLGDTVLPSDIQTYSNQIANDWPDESTINRLIEVDADKIVLNVGAGYITNVDRYFRHHNVINTDIVSHPTTDVLCEGDNLPFLDNSIDTVLSISILECVENPQDHISEMIRVLKPGGTLYISTSFLQPYHGKPHHYFNITLEGINMMLGKHINIIDNGVEKWNRPINSISWTLSKYCDGLPEEHKEEFNELTVYELIHMNNDNTRTELMTIDDSIEKDIAAGVSIVGTKNSPTE